MLVGKKFYLLGEDEYTPPETPEATPQPQPPQGGILLRSEAVEMEPMSKELCEAKHKAYDERFDRDKERIEDLEEMQKQFLTLQGQLTEILKNQEKQLNEQNKRICELEKKPGQWLDRIISAALSAIIAFAVATLKR